MSISAYSVTMAIFWFSMAGLIGSVTLRRVTRGSLLYVTVIFLLALIRCLFPYEFSGSIIIRSKSWYPFLQNLVQTPLFGFTTVGGLLLCIWLGTALLCALRLVRKLFLLSRFRRFAPVEPPESKFSVLACEAAAEHGYTGPVDVYISPTAASPYQTGFLRPFVILPASAAGFSDEKILCMLRHEISHFLGNDLWVKNTVNLLMCILWWNPVSAMLRSSIEHALEIRCDHRVCSKLTPEEQHTYLDTLLDLARQNQKKTHAITSGYLGTNSEPQIRQRFLLITAAIKEPRRNDRMISSLVLSIFLFIASYAIIVQPWINMPPTDSFGAEVLTNNASTVNYNTVVVPKGTYIVHTVEGKYKMYSDFEYVCTIPIAELNNEPYCNYKIYEGGYPNEEKPHPKN